MDQYDTSQLTEFPRFEPESSQSGVSTFLNKLWKLPIFSPGETGENSQNKALADGKGDSPQNEDGNKQEYDDIKTEPASYAVELEGRSLQNVLRRISSLVALGSSSGSKYADTELARYWMPDDISRECYECAARFRALRRRHHCRVCGQIFCARCCSQRVPGQIFGCAGGLRVCNYCCNVVLSYLRENDMAGEISPDLRTLQENLQVKFPDNKSQQSKTRDNFMFAREQDDKNDRGSPKEAMHDVFRQLVYMLPTQQHRYRLVRYNGVWRGCDVIQWITENTSHKTRAQATQVCQSLVSGGYMECVTELSHFADYGLYRPAPAPATTLPDADQTPDEEHTRLVESASSYCLDLDLGESSARLTKTPKTTTAEPKSSPSSEEETPNLEQSEGPGVASKLCKALEESGEDHLKLLMRQCLSSESLSCAWLDILYPLCVQAAEIIMPDLHSSDIDVRNYVQVKKLPDGNVRDSRVVPGVVLTKNVAHRAMPQKIDNPTILLLDCSIAYQRVEGKLTSLEPVLLQEQEYLSRCAARITALRPGVVAARGGAARPVLEALRGARVALVFVTLLCRMQEQEYLSRCAARITALRPGVVAARGGAARPVLEALRGARVALVFVTLLCRMQEQEYLSRCAARITALRPGVVAARGGAARPVLEALRGARVALVAAVAPRALRRLARCTRADLVASVDARIAVPRLGSCRHFSVTTYPSKTLMTFEGCAEPHLGCCILLCGAPLSELARVKKVVKFMLLACYNWKLEKAFLADIEAILPEPGMTFEDEADDEKDQNDTLSEDGIDRNDVFDVENDQNVESAGDRINESDVHSDIIDTATVNDVEKNNDYPVKDTDEKFDDAKLESDTKEPFDDPLTSTFVRKTESDRLSCGVPIRDFSDPLRATMSVEDEVFLPTEESLKADTQTDRWTTDDKVLSISPNIIIPAPYLETEAGRRCPLRKYFPRPLLRVPARPPPTPRVHRTVSRQHHSVEEVMEPHPFIARPITCAADEPALRAAHAHYRAVGARLPDAHTTGCPLYNPSVMKPAPKEPEVEEKGTGELDPLAPENHQKLVVLLYSYSRKSANAPDFCVNPWIVTMEMYGRHDITLGAFLDKYCFNSEYKCPSNNCSVPVNQHVRRFVHGDVCITITCNIIGHSNMDKVKEVQNKQVMFWSRCSACGASGRARRLSGAALALSLALYVRARGGGRGLRARACRHALHAHAHVFARDTAAACFRYTKITPYEIQLPPDVISIKYDTKVMREGLINQLNELMLKGHETFSSVSDTEAEKDYQAFKHHMDQIHLALTSGNLQENTTLAAVVRSLWNVSDRIIFGEKMLRDAQEKWASPAPKSKPLPDTPAEEKSDLEESSSEAVENSEPKDDKEHAGAEEDEEKGDKKTVRQILSQLLSNKEASNQSGMIISSGLVPVVVMAGEIGSVIAATLASVTYQRTLTAHRYSTQTEQEESESSAAGKDKTDGEKSKAKSNDHIEVLLKDGLLCRVYYAPQFHKLRHVLLAPLHTNPHIADSFAGAAPPPPPPPPPPPGLAPRCCDDARDKTDSKSLCDLEEGFIRSLAHCVPWAAKGGKSGSTFCKTKDDRYVLKEMTKPEWQQFLEFAPHYFNYITNCRNQQLPSLLARILGVYSVGGAGNGVLVMENVWYGSAGGAARRFDLKGSSRHRLAPLAPLAVLLDENLLQLRWEEQLFVQSHTGSVLFSCIDRDSEFLAANSVMDYSLLLGVESGRLVFGIIDYIRTFTWDKKLEHLVKKNLGSGQPTVVSPDEYKRRFRAAMRKYFLRCVTPWDHLL